MAKKDYIALGVFAVFLALLPFVVKNDYYLGVLVFTALNCLAATGLSLLLGYAGQISLGHAAFIAIGAYISALFSVRMGWSSWGAMGAGAFISALVALLIGAPSLRLKGHYLAMATLGFGSIIHIILVAWVDITGGPSGITGIPKLSIFGFALETDRSFYYFSWGVVVTGLFFAFNLIHSRIGRGLRAIHGSEDAASSLGVSTSVLKIQVFVISAVYASVSGSLYASYVNYIDPGPFGVMHSVLLVTMVAVGGMHSLWGAVTGAVLLSLLPEFLSFLADYLSNFGIAYQSDYDTLVYGGILLFIMLYLPEGLFGGALGLGKKISGFFRGKDNISGEAE